jgi:hypothetical protein
MGAKTLFHGTAYRFSHFCSSASGIHFGSLEQAAHAATLKLASLPVKDFAALSEDAHGFRGIILECRLNIHRTKRVKDARNSGGWARVITAAKQQGFDSLVYRNRWEGREPQDSFVVFDPSCIEIIRQANG